MADILAVVSDLHGNHPFGLLPADGITLQNGQHVTPNLTQQWSWDRWVAYWDWVADCKRETGGRLVVAVLGEFVDGFHHGSTEFLSASEDVMRQIGAAIMKPAMALEPSSLLVIKGTEAHSGKEGSNDNAVARELGAVENPETGEHSFYERAVSVNGTRAHLRHHVSGSQRPWTRGGEVNRLAAQLTYDYYRDAPENRPHLAYRGHIHPDRRLDSGALHPIRAIILNCWQIASSFGHKVDQGAGIRPVGGDVLLCEGEHYESRYRLWNAPRGKAMVL